MLASSVQYYDQNNTGYMLEYVVFIILDRITWISRRDEIHKTDISPTRG